MTFSEEVEVKVHTAIKCPGWNWNPYLKMRNAHSAWGL